MRAQALPLRAFGVSFTVQGATILPPAGYVAEGNQSTFDAGSGIARLNFERLRPAGVSDAVPLRMLLLLRVRRTANGYELEGEQPAGPGFLLRTQGVAAETRAIAVRVPALTLGGAPRGNGRVQNGTSEITYGVNLGPTDLLAGAAAVRLPVGLFGGPAESGAVSGVSFDLAGWRVRIFRDTLRLHLRARTDGAPSFETQHPNEAFDVALRTTPKQVEVAFGNAETGAGIGLHMDWVRGSDTRQVLMPIGLRGGRLALTMAAVAAGGMAIRKILAVQDWRLVTYAAGSLENEAALWRGSSALELGVRPQIGVSATRVGTLLIRPISRANALPLEQLTTGPLHGALVESRLEPASTRARLVCDAAPGTIPAATVQAITGVEPSLLHLQTLPWIALPKDSELLVSRPGRAYRKDNTSVISPYRIR